MVLNVHRNHKAYKVRGEGGGGYGEGGGRGRLYTYCYNVTIRLTLALSWAAMRPYDETHFNPSLFVRDKLGHKTVSTDHNLFEEKGESKRNRAQALQCLPAYTPYR